MSTTDRNPLPDVDLTDAVWRKASASGGNGNGCIELTRVGDVIGLRDSKNPDQPAHLYTLHELSCFLDGARRGEFDDLVS